VKKVVAKPVVKPVIAAYGHGGYGHVGHLGHGGYGGY